MADIKSRFKNFMGFGNTAEELEDEYEDTQEVSATSAKAVSSEDDFSISTRERYNRVSASSASGQTSSSVSSSHSYKSEASSDKSGERSGKILNMGVNSSLRVVLSKPTAFDNCEAICSHLRGQMTVVLNLEYVADAGDRRRIFDFVSGCCYALDCSIQRVSDLIYVVAPSHVDVFAEVGDDESETAQF